MPAARRQHGRPADRIWAGLLAWPGGGLRFCRRRGANMGARQAGFEPAPIQSKTACRRNSSSCKPTSSLSFPFVSPSLCRAPTVSLFVFLQSVFFYKIIRCILRCTVHPGRCPRKCIRGRLPEHLRRCRCAVPGTACRPRCRTKCLPDPAA